MKYFTAERWLAFQDVTHDRVIQAAHDDWNRALADYGKELTEIRSQLPTRLRYFAEQECLHDAELLSSWVRPGTVSMLLRPDLPSSTLFLLHYSGVETREALNSGIPAEYHTPHAIWLYDEISLDPDGAQAEPRNRVYKHAILLSNGLELLIRFRKLQYWRPEAWLPLENGQSLPPVSAVPQSA